MVWVVVGVLAAAALLVAGMLGYEAARQLRALGREVADTGERFGAALDELRQVLARGARPDDVRSARPSLRR